VNSFDHSLKYLVGLRAETRLNVLDAWLDEAVLTADEQGLGQLIEHIKRTPLPTPR
jgi:hypothetical protein